MKLEASVVRYAAGTLLDRHAHSAGSVSVVLAGSIEEQVGARTEIGRIGSMVSKPAGVEHSNRVGRGGAILLAIRGKDADDVAASGWRWTESSAAAAESLQLARTLRRGAAVDNEQLLDLLGLAGEFVESPRNARWLSEIRLRLDRDPVVPSVAEIASDADVHPVYLARAFRKQFGCSIREYRRKERVRRAANLLATCDLPIATVAAAVGFFDQSHLCRDFRAELNVSPRDYRAIIRA